MNSVKENLHTLIDTISDDELLESVYELLRDQSKNEGRIWASLTAEQQKEVISITESIGRTESIPHQTMIELNKKWLSK
jgi:hypothetical protein